MYIVTVDADKCEGCGECADSCPGGVLEMVDGKSTVANPDECLGCETCVSVCPSGAITLQEQ